MGSDLCALLRGTIINRIYGTHKNLCVSLFLLLRGTILLLIIQIRKYIPGRFLCVPWVLFNMLPRNRRAIFMHHCGCIPGRSDVDRVGA